MIDFIVLLIRGAGYAYLDIIFKNFKYGGVCFPLDPPMSIYIRMYILRWDFCNANRCNLVNAYYVTMHGDDAML